MVGRSKSDRQTPNTFRRIRSNGILFYFTFAYSHTFKVPKAFVLMGNFTYNPLLAGDHYQLKTYMANLANLILEYRLLANGSKFILVPGILNFITNTVKLLTVFFLSGPADPCGNVLNVLPHNPLPTVFVQPLLDKLPKNNVILATNPCRIRYCTQEIVVFRDDLVNKMRRHCVFEPKYRQQKKREKKKRVIEREKELITTKR